MISLLILFLCVSVLFSFLCSLWEAVLLSITPTYAEARLRDGSAIGRQLLTFKENIDRPLAAILTLNTIAHTVGAIGVGAQAALIWGDSHPLLTGLVVPALMTLAILVLSEIIPKTLGASYWQQFTRFTVLSLRLVIAALYPLVWISQRITALLKTDKSKSVFSRSEFLAMAEIGAREGVFRRRESEIIASLLRFESVRARDVMTPRTVVKAAPEAMPLREYHRANPDLRFSRIPVYGADKDRMTGYVLKDDLLARLVDATDDPLMRDIKREILVVPEPFPIPELLSRFIEQREHIALVVDEFGGTSGIVTMEDVIETLLGVEIVDEQDRTVDMQSLARESWKKRARSLGLIEDDPA